MSTWNALERVKVLRESNARTRVSVEPPKQKNAFQRVPRATVSIVLNYFDKPPEQSKELSTR